METSLGMKRHSYAKERSKLARQLQPLGRFIVDQIHKRIPLPTLPRPQPQGGVAATPAQPRVSPPPPADAIVREGRPHRGKAGNTREAPVLHASLACLRRHGIFAHRQNTGMAWINGQPVSFGFPGAADVTGILPDGRRLEVECKSPTGKQSDKQRRYQQRIEENHGVYWLIRSVEELEERLRALGL